MPRILSLAHQRQLLPGTLLGRRKRFLADVQLADGSRVVAHCVNPGRMEGMVIPGAPVFVSRAPPGTKRKLAYTLELVRVGRSLIGANTVEANRIVEALLTQRLLSGFRRYDELRREYRYGERSRADFWVRRGTRQTFIEVKNCHLVYADKRGYFPDSVSDRATRHLEELCEVVRSGNRALVLFLVQHPSARAVRPSDVHDPTFAEAARAARRAGVQFRGLRVRTHGSGVHRRGDGSSRPEALRHRANSAVSSGQRSLVWLRVVTF